MLAEQVRQDQIANDLANAVDARLQGRPHGAARASASCCSPTRATGAHGRLAGHGRAGRRRSRPTSRPSPRRDTGEPLDFAIVGEGFFAVQTAQGVRYTRNGQFTADAAGPARDRPGRPGARPRRPPVRVGADGRVDPRALERRRACDNPRKDGDNLVTGTPGGAAAPARSARARSRARAPTPARSMVDMIASLRAFEAGQKVIQTIDETLGKAADAGRRRLGG